MNFFRRMPPNGYFIDGLIIYQGLEAGGYAVKGFKLSPPCFRNASFGEREEFKRKVIVLLQSLSEKEHIQFQWNCTSDYAKELVEFHEKTQLAQEAHVREVRSEKFVRLWEKMERGELRREELFLFASIGIEGYTGNFKLKRDLERAYEAKLQQIKVHFDEFYNKLNRLFGGEVMISAMGDEGHSLFYQNLLNPSSSSRKCTKSNKELDSSKSIQEKFLICDGVGTETGFYYDGNFHGLVSVMRWPSRTTFGDFYTLTGLVFLDYVITVNIFPKNASKEVKREEKELERIQGEYASDGAKRSLLSAIELKQAKIDSLSSGYICPFDVEYVIRVWDKTKEGLNEKLNTIKQAVSSMGGAQLYEAALPTSAKNLFFNTWPGYRGSDYPYRRIYAEDTYLSDLIPFSASFYGCLENAEVIFDGDQGNLVGVTTFRGTTPQHTVLVGMSGAGKSCFMREVLEQTQGYCDYTAIIEEGLSYESYTRSLGEEPIVIRGDGEKTINYFDTMGLPLSSEHISNAVGIVSCMLGESNISSELRLKRSLIEEYIRQAYLDCLDEWMLKNRSRIPEMQKMAYAAFIWHEQGREEGLSFSEAFSVLNINLRESNDRALEIYESIKDEEAISFASNPETEQYYKNTAFAFLEPKDFCRHEYLVELMKYAVLPGHDKKGVNELATLLNSWTASGQYGKLFDGVSNIDLRRKITHFELGYIREGDVELKQAAGLLITNNIRQHIVSMPRQRRKRIIFEEVARFLDVPGGEKIVSEAYAQLRKFSCCAISIVQQYAKFRQSGIRSAIMGNSKQYWIMRQNDRQDLEDMAGDIGLPEIAIDSIMNYPLPEHQNSSDRYSSICYFNPSGNPKFCGTMHHEERVKEGAKK